MQRACFVQLVVALCLIAGSGAISNTAERPSISEEPSVESPLLYYGECSFHPVVNDTCR